MSDLLLIPAAKFIAPELQLDFGLIPPVLLPLGTSTALDYITSNLSYDKCYVGLLEEYQRVENYIKNKNLDASTILLENQNTPKSNQLGYTIKYMLENSNLQPGDSVFINFGDTIILEENRNFIKSEKDVIYISEITEKFRWTLIDLENGQVQFYDKNILKKPDSGRVIAGLFYIKDAISFLSTLQEEWENQPIELSDGKDLFYFALESYLNKRNDLHIQRVPKEKWVDLGHLDTFYKSKANFLNARHFNSFEIDLFWGKVKKKSVYKKKFIDEINWYISLPIGLKSLIPNIYSFSTEENPFVELEYYSYPTLNQIYLFSNITHSQWKEIFTKLLQVHKEFRNYPKSLDRNSLKSFYFEKTKQRITDLKKDKTFEPFFEKDIIANKTKYPSLTYLLSTLEQFIEDYIINTPVTGSIIHGDYCLSNILYDVKTGMIKIIDPRGSFIDVSVYGDPRYDLAKLTHSIHGYYDHILTGNYELLETNSLEYSLTIFNSEEHSSLSAILIDLMEENDFDTKQILAIESLLFLSMIPLHSDDTKRQKAFLLRGLELYYSIQKSI